MTRNKLLPNEHLVVMKRDLNRLDEALVHYRASFKLNPTDAGTLRNIGMASAFMHMFGCKINKYVYRCRHYE